MKAPRQSAGRTRPIVERALPSGRSLVVRGIRAGEEIEVLSPDGEVEVRIACGPAGPVVTVRAARLDVEARDLGVRCDTLAVAASGGIRLETDRDVAISGRGRFSVRVDGNVDLNGGLVRLNCTDEGAAGPAR